MIKAELYVWTKIGQSELDVRMKTHNCTQCLTSIYCVHKISARQTAMPETQTLHPTFASFTSLLQVSCIVFCLHHECVAVNTRHKVSGSLRFCAGRNQSLERISPMSLSSLIAMGRSPLSDSLPPMKALVGFSFPVNILMKVSRSMTKVTSAFP